jgi:hypothetical protein
MRAPCDQRQPRAAVPGAPRHRQAPPHISTEDPATYSAAPGLDPATWCCWSRDALDGDWATACNQAFVFNDGGPEENAFRFCPYCGRVIVVDVAAGQGDAVDGGAP